jgi:large subunit ribosomal protein L17
MKHAIKGRKLGRNTAHRKALLRNLALSILTHESIKTTLPKAKEIRPYAEKILSLAKKDNLANRRLAISLLGNQEIINKLFTDLGPRIANRNGGYLKIMKFGFRTGDKAPMAIIELVDKKEKDLESEKTQEIEAKQE